MIFNMQVKNVCVSKWIRTNTPQYRLGYVYVFIYLYSIYCICI